MYQHFVRLNGSHRCGLVSQPPAAKSGMAAVRKATVYRVSTEELCCVSLYTELNHLVHTWIDIHRGSDTLLMHGYMCFLCRLPRSHKQAWWEAKAMKVKLLL